MKKFSIFTILPCVFMLTTASTCSNDDDDSNSSSANTQPVVNAASNGTWHVSYYYDTDSEETGQFTNYDFTFDAGNVLTAANGTNTYTGSWSVTNSNGSDDDDDSSDIDFNIAFSSPANFAELTDDWEIISFTSNEIRLIDISGGNGGTDYLTFTKN